MKAFEILQSQKDAKLNRIHMQVQIFVFIISNSCSVHNNFHNSYNAYNSYNVLIMFHNSYNVS